MRDLAGALAQRRKQHLYRHRRTIDGPQGPHLQSNGQALLSFCSNDYLGLASHPRLIEAMQQGVSLYGVGSGASHLVCGHSKAHHDLEQALADFCGQPRALLFSNGYMANLGVITALADRHDGIFQDKLNHASLIDAAQLSGGTLRRFPHLNTDALKQQLDVSKYHDSIIATDGVFSMDGDIAPLPQLLQLANTSDSWLVIDEAHALGTLGIHGRGCREYFGLPDKIDRLITVGTLGKAFGTSGAFVAGSADLIETLIQLSRTYIYTTAPPPAIAHATLASLRLIENEDWRRIHLTNLIQYFRHQAQQASLPLMDSETAIQPLLLGSSECALNLSEQLIDKGFLVSAIRPPTVPQGQARLRITLSAAHQEEQIDQLIHAIVSSLNSSPLKRITT